ncbi:endonuclease/exonuclease/phosphatase family protein [Alsobacter sp. SYSU BS001988]
MKLRVATFNIENLSSRWRFAEAQRGDVTAAMSLAEFARPIERETAERSVGLTLEDDKRQMTALAVAESRADLICLQEVDSLRVLEAFFANYVHRMSDIRYGHFKLVEGNDRRGIDVAFAARRNLLAADQVKVASHREATFGEFGVYGPEIAAFGIRPDDRVFNRDCLMVDLQLDGAPLTLFVCHLKSMNNGKDDGRAATMPLRRAEAQAVRALIRRRFGERWREAHWIVAGDLNDYREIIGPGGSVTARTPSGLDDLIEGFGVNPVADLPVHERWTHFHRAWSETEQRIREEHVQLDYVLLSPALAARGAAVTIVRRGLPYRTPLDPRDPDRSIASLALKGDRYPRVGWDRPKASDHCLLVVEIDLPALSSAP